MLLLRLIFSQSKERNMNLGRILISHKPGSDRSKDDASYAHRVLFCLLAFMFVCLDIFVGWLGGYLPRNTLFIRRSTRVCLVHFLDVSSPLNVSFPHHFQWFVIFQQIVKL